MAETIVNTPPQTNENSNGMWNFFGVLLAAVVILLIVFYGIPVIRSSIGGISGPQIEVPKKIDINVNQQK